MTCPGQAGPKIHRLFRPGGGAIRPPDEAYYYRLHEKRGSDAIEEIGLLELFEGLLVHDFWKPYFDLDDVTHCMCVAQLLRELNNPPRTSPSLGPKR